MLLLPLTDWTASSETQRSQYQAAQINGGTSHSSKEITETLVISVKTVQRHRANLLQKLGLRDRLELTAMPSGPA
jgi:DNA-binding NarL/FixJ family response regulator